MRLIFTLLVMAGITVTGSATGARPMNWEILDQLDTADRDRVLAAAVRKTFRRATSIVRQGEHGDSLHLIAIGRAAVQVSTPDGDVVTIAVIGPGEHFGEQALVGEGGVRIATVVALETVETVALRRVDFQRLRAQHPAIDDVLIRALSDRVNRLTAQLVEAHFMTAEARVHRCLRELTAIYGGSCGTGAVSIALTQEQLAELAGTSRPTVNGVLAELARSGIVSVRRGAVDVHDVTALARMTQPSHSL